MKICQKCEKEYDDDFNFCEDCGEKLVTKKKIEKAEPNKIVEVKEKKESKSFEKYQMHYVIAVIQLCIGVYSLFILINTAWFLGAGMIVNVDTGLMYLLITLLAFSTSFSNYWKHKTAR
ncbi:hypothetical protein JW868_03375 [Candidatus Woesearchaeota archaeon]|nr:hypothetical protein [Candidatus Woesearchaeota archaeon]